jgi:hypothetical protein
MPGDSENFRLSNALALEGWVLRCALQCDLSAPQSVERDGAPITLQRSGFIPPVTTEEQESKQRLRHGSRSCQSVQG